MISELMSAQQTVGEIVSEHPALGRVFENLGIDYCKRGNRPLEAACRREGINPQTVLAMLRGQLAAGSVVPRFDPSAASLGDLVDHITSVHHDFLREELPRLHALCERVVLAHAARDPRLGKVREVLDALTVALVRHIEQQNRSLFPAVKQLECSEDASRSRSAWLARSIQQLQSEQDVAELALCRLRDLTDGFRSPEWACNSYRVLLDGLSVLLRDMHLHLHKENDVLYPRALTLDVQLRSASAATRTAVTCPSVTEPIFDPHHLPSA